jgi:predicted nucleic acid-binding protein
MIFADANIFVHAFTNSSKRKQCQELVMVGVATNTFCLAEAHQIITKITKDPLYASACMKSVFRGNVGIIAVDENTFFSAMKFIPRLKTFDAVHYAAAHVHGCEAIASYDQDFDGLPLKRVEP